MGKQISLKIVVTGADGLLGWHASARLHAANCAATYQKKPKPYELVALSRAKFNDLEYLRAALQGAQIVLHFAGVNRAPDDVLEVANSEIASILVEACKYSGSDPYIVYANSIHSQAAKTAYGRSKNKAHRIFKEHSNRYTNLVLPHIFGEYAKPNYNNVTATLIHQIINGEKSEINPEGSVTLLHAGDAVELAISSAVEENVGDIYPSGKTLRVQDLYSKLLVIHDQYSENIFPSCANDFDLALFNTYRSSIDPEEWPMPLQLNQDSRGVLFEAFRAITSGQVFMSTTQPGITRGDHFHLTKVERFVVVEGNAIIRIRKIMSGDLHEFGVNGETPVAIDMPVMQTHSIENVGNTPLITLFWTSSFFDPDNPDTFFDRVLV